MGLTGKWLRQYTLRLIKKGSIKRIGDKGPYFPVYDVYGDPIIDAKLFAGNFESLFLSKIKQLAFNQSSSYFVDNISGRSHFEDFSTTKKYFEFGFGIEDVMEYRLFEFSNRLGAFMTYTIIQAMNTDNFIDSTPAIQNQLSRIYIEESFSGVVRTVAQRFRQLFQDLVSTQYIGNQKPPNEVEIRYDPIFPYDKETIFLFLKAFSNIYPLLTLEFERIRGKPYVYKKLLSNISPPIEQYKKRLDMLQRNLERQLTCRHEFKKPIRIFQGYAKQCKKYMLTEKLKKSKP